MILGKLLLWIGFSFFLAHLSFAQDEDRLIQFPKQVFPGMSRMEVAKIDPALVKGSVMDSNEVQYMDSLLFMSEEMELYYQKGILVEMEWSHSAKSLDADERKELMDATRLQIDYFTELYGKPEEYTTNPVPEDFLRQWRSIVYAYWKTPSGKIEVRLDYLTRVFEDPAEIEDGTYDREFELEISYRR